MKKSRKWCILREEEVKKLGGDGQPLWWCETEQMGNHTATAAAQVIHWGVWCWMKACRSTSALGSESAEHTTVVRHGSSSVLHYERKDLRGSYHHPKKPRSKGEYCVLPVRSKQGTQSPWPWATVLKENLKRQHEGTEQSVGHVANSSVFIHVFFGHTVNFKTVKNTIQI